eukprot:c11268_g1_i1.p1 GENE.c11268_g1_i1~~c11268_g1_i1.p1  ORF type:complete len:309 (+),score=44.35 c11268_g1_i1:34-960(+)
MLPAKTLLVVAFLFSAFTVFVAADELADETASPTPTESETLSITITPSESESPTVSESESITPSITPSESITSSETPSVSFSQSISSTSTHSRSSSPSQTSTVSSSSSPSVSRSPSPSPAPPFFDAKARVTVVIVLSFVLVAGAGGFLIIQAHRHGLLGGVRHLSPFGFSLAVCSIIAVSCAGSVMKVTADGEKIFASDALRYLVACHVLALSKHLFFGGLEFMERIPLRRTVMVVDTILGVFVMAASIASTVRFEGNHEYCQSGSSHRYLCVTYQTSIFFTWVLYFGLGLKVLTNCVCNTRAPYSVI